MQIAADDRRAVAMDRLAFGLGTANATVLRRTAFFSVSCCEHGSPSPRSRRHNAARVVTTPRMGLGEFLQGLFRPQQDDTVDKATSPGRAESNGLPQDDGPAVATKLAEADSTKDPAEELPQLGASNPAEVQEGGRALAAAASASARKPRAAAPLRRDPRKVLVVGAASKLGRAVVSELRASVGGSAEYYIVGAVEDGPADAPAGCDRVISVSLPAQTAFLAQQARSLGIGRVIWCPVPPRDLTPRDVDYIALRDFVRDMAGESSLPKSQDGFPTYGDDGWLKEPTDVIEILDMSRPDDRQALRVMDDVIMGGMSASSLVPGFQASNSAVPAVWKGNVSLGKGGGFASLRAELPFEGIPQSTGVDLSACAGIAITCRGDGKRYKVNLKNDSTPEFVFQASFDTEPGPNWQTIRIPFTDFVPVKRAGLAYADGGAEDDSDPDSMSSPKVFTSTLDPSRVTSIGLVLSKLEPGGLPCPKFTPGPFRLELAQIDAYLSSPPRLVVVSSAAVTRPFWDETRRKLYRQSAEIPIVELNETIGNILGAKLAGENEVRESGIPYTIVRPTGLVDDAPTGRALTIEQGDFAVGRTPIPDAARAIVAAFDSNSASWKTFELNGNPREESTPEETVSYMTSALAKLTPDPVQKLYSSALESP